MMKDNVKVTAIILAAGLSSRMGSPKMLLEWKGKTVLDAVLQAVTQSKIAQTILVYGAFSENILKISEKYPVQAVFNPDYSNGSMLLSLQTGLVAIKEPVDGIMIILGDQPGLKSSTIDQVLFDFQRTGMRVVIPSFNMRRGHPWVIDKSLVKEILDLKEPETLRVFLGKHQSDIFYSEVDDPNILADMDTPDDYRELIGR